MHKRSVLSLLVLGLASSACDDAAAEDELVEFERPQIVPQSNVLCLSLSDEAFVEGQAHDQFVQLTNRGRDPLLIEEARIEEDARGAFRVAQVRAVGRAGDSTIDCTVENPCAIGSTEDAVIRYVYEPPAPGWDTAEIWVRSNAQNYPRLRLFVLANARPADLDPDASFDPGPKPANAIGADGSETCPED